MQIPKNSKIFLAGHRGLVGSAILNELRQQGYQNIITRTHRQADLTNQQVAFNLFKKEKPEFVILAAAKVGGIGANNTYPADFIYQNIQIQTNVIHAAYKYGLKKLLFLGSSCIYPKKCPQPIKEEYLLSSKLEPTNEPYAIAKIAGMKMCQHYNRQYGTNFIATMPTNLYGPRDNFHLENAHVLPALIHRFHKAKERGAKKVVVWGSGKPKREFLYIQDLAKGCLYLMRYFNPTKEQNEKGEIFLNLGSGEEITIKKLAQMVKQTVGFKGELVWDTSKPDGTPRKFLDSSKIFNLGWKPQTSLKKGLEKTYEWFLENYKHIRK